MRNLCIFLGFLCLIVDINSQRIRFPTSTRPTESRRPTLTNGKGRKTTSTLTTSPPPVAGVVFQIPNCDCPSTFEYNPVCGTDGRTYANSQKIRCAKRCGTNVDIARRGNCILVNRT